MFIQQQLASRAARILFAPENSPASWGNRLLPCWLRALRSYCRVVDQDQYAFLGHYKPHPDPNQEKLFFGLLKECIEQGAISETMVREQMNLHHVRHDAFEVLERTPPLAPA